MTRTCTVCSHKDVDEINKLLISGESYRSIAKQFEASESAVYRHKESHIPNKLLKADDIKETVTADNLFKSLQDEAVVVRELRDQARSEGNVELALKAVDRALKCIEIYAKVQGRIQEQSVNVNVGLQQVNIYQSPEWLAVGSLLARILGPYPELRAEVAKEFIALEDAHR